MIFYVLDYSQWGDKKINPRNFTIRPQHTRGKKV